MKTSWTSRRWDCIIINIPNSGGEKEKMRETTLSMVDRSLLNTPPVATTVGSLNTPSHIGRPTGGPLALTRLMLLIMLRHILSSDSIDVGETTIHSHCTVQNCSLILLSSHCHVWYTGYGNERDVHVER